MVLRGALRGAKDVRVPALIGVGVVWTCVPLAALLLGRLAGWGAVGGWLGFLGETSLGTALLAWRWRRGAWRRAYSGGASTQTSLSIPASTEWVRADAD
jgi:MATE family multidrug resistance protein